MEVLNRCPFRQFKNTLKISIHNLELMKDLKDAATNVLVGFTYSLTARPC